MPSQKSQREAQANAAVLEQAEAEAATTAEQREELNRHIPPIVRDEENSFVPVADFPVTDPEVIQPDLTNTSLDALETKGNEESFVDIPIPQGYGVDALQHRVQITPEAVERMNDEQIAALLSEREGQDKELIHPARQAPSSERPRTPLQRAPAAGAGSWPIPEDSLPAAMPSDGERKEASGPGDNTFKGVSGFKVKEGGDLDAKSTRSGTTVTIPKKQVAAAAAIYMTLRQQHPDWTDEMLADEFILQAMSLSGEAQSHRPADEISQHGLTAVGDDRVTLVEAGRLRQDAPLAEPAPLPPEPDTALANEPAATQPDQAKQPDGTAFDHDGDGKVGGSKPKASPSSKSK